MSTDNITPINKIRNSNLELYRIIVMLLIVAHHYVVNSGIMPIILDTTNLTNNDIFCLLFGMWGKTGINCFVMITGYFMCKSETTIKKFLKLLMEVIFYKTTIYIIFIITGIINFSFKNFIFSIIPIYNVNDDFVAAFILFYLFIPFLNKLIQNLTQKQHQLLILLSLFVYTFWDMIPNIEVRYNYVIWFSIIYYIAAYIRFYPITKHDYNTKLWGFLTIICVLISSISVLGLFNLKVFHPYGFVSDSNAILALLTAICSFMYFKNLKIKQSPLINMMGASTFGVLLIHANSDAMRQWLWKDTLNNTNWLDSPFLCIHAIISVIGIFVICIVIDQLRIRFIETPFFKTRLYQRIEASISHFIK